MAGLGGEGPATRSECARDEPQPVTSPTASLAETRAAQPGHLTAEHGRRCGMGHGALIKSTKGVGLRFEIFG